MKKKKSAKKVSKTLSPAKAKKLSSVRKAKNQSAAPKLKTKNQSTIVKSKVRNQSTTTKSKVKNKSLFAKSKVKQATVSTVNSPPADKMFLQKMIENLLPQMAEKILRRAQSVGQVLKKRKIK